MEERVQPPVWEVIRPFRQRIDRLGARATLTSQFSFDRQWEHDDYVSLLFWLGMLTVYEKPVGGGWAFRAPNAVIKQLYYGYFAETLRQRTKLKEGMYEEISRAVVSMAADNDLKPFLRLEEKAGEARAQLQEYLQTDDLRQVPKLAAYAVVFVGSEAQAVEQVA